MLAPVCSCSGLRWSAESSPDIGKMDNDDAIILIFLAFIAAAHKLLCSYYMVSNDLPTLKEKKEI